MKLYTKKILLSAILITLFMPVQYLMANNYNFSVLIIHKNQNTRNIIRDLTRNYYNDNDQNRITFLNAQSWNDAANWRYWKEHNVKLMYLQSQEPLWSGFKKMMEYTNKLGISVIMVLPSYSRMEKRYFTNKGVYDVIQEPLESKELFSALKPDDKGYNDYNDGYNDYNDGYNDNNNGYNDNNDGYNDGYNDSNDGYNDYNDDYNDNNDGYNDNNDDYNKDDEKKKTLEDNLYNLFEVIIDDITN